MAKIRIINWKKIKRKIMTPEQIRKWDLKKEMVWEGFLDKIENVLRKLEYFESDEIRMSTRKAWEIQRNRMGSTVKGIFWMTIIYSYGISLIYQATLCSVGSISRIYYNPAAWLYYGVFYKGHILLSFAFSIVTVIGVTIWKRKYDIRAELRDDERGFTRAVTDEYGSAHEMDENEKRQILDRDDDPMDAINNILGVERGTGKILSMRANLPPQNQLGVHTFICGSSGMRKSRSVAIPYVYKYIERGESFICTDPKGELYGKTASIAEEEGYDVKVFNLVDPVCSDGCAFLKIVGKDTVMAQRFAEVLISNAGEGAVGGDPVYENGEKALVAFGILYTALDENIAEEDKTLSQVYKFLVESCLVEVLNEKGEKVVSQEDSITRMSNIAAQLPQSHPAKQQWDIFMTASDKLRGNILTGLASKLQLLLVPEIQAITKYDEIDLVEPGRKKCAYYVIMSDTDKTLNYISAVFFSFLFIKLVRYADRRKNGKCLVPVNFLLDEFPNVGNIPGFKEKMNTIRSRDLKAVVICQDLGQMMDRYPGHGWESIISACDTMILLGLNEHVTNAEWWAKKTGTMTIEVKTQHAGASGTGMNGADMENVGKGRRYVYTPDEIDHMDRGEQLLFLSGFNVLKCLKFDYSGHPFCKREKLTLASRHIPAWWRNEEGHQWFEQSKSDIMEMWREQDEDEDEQNKMKYVKKKTASEKAEEYFINDEVPDENEEILLSDFIKNKINSRKKKEEENEKPKKQIKKELETASVGIGAHVVCNMEKDEIQENLATTASDLLSNAKEMFNSSSKEYMGLPEFSLLNTEDGFDNFDFSEVEDMGQDENENEDFENYEYDDYNNNYSSNDYSDIDDFGYDEDDYDEDDYDEDDYDEDDYDESSLDDDFFNNKNSVEVKGAYKTTGRKF